MLEATIRQIVSRAISSYCRLSGMRLTWPAQHPTMNKPSKTPGICRIDQPSHRTHGFFVRVQRGGKIHSGFFTDLSCGGKRRALLAAQWFLRQIQRRLGKMDRKAWAKIVRRRGRSGIYGVQRVIDRKSKPWRKYWRAIWSPKPYVVRKRQFSIRKHGEEGARQLAIRARRAGLRSMVD